MALEKIMYGPEGCWREDQCDHDVTGEWLGADDLQGEGYCPVCNGRNIEHVANEYGSSDTVFMDYHCKDCGSEFAIEYIFSGALVQRDGRYHKEEE